MVASPEDGNAGLAKAYVREMLELNPMWQSATILRRRRELWGGNDPATNSQAKPRGDSATSDSASQKEQADHRREQRARRILETLQSQFYRLPEDKLKQYIQFLQHDRLPEFAAKAKRLREVSKHRKTLLAIEKRSDDPKFTYSLLHGLVCPATQAGALKEQYIESIIADRRVKPSCKMIREFVEQHPGIYKLERDWLDLFLDKTNQKRWNANYSLTASATSSQQTKLVVVSVVIGLVVTMLVLIADNQQTNLGGSNSSNSSRSTFQPKMSPGRTDENSEVMAKLRELIQQPASSATPAMDSMENPIRKDARQSLTMPSSQGTRSHEEIIEDFQSLRTNPLHAPLHGPLHGPLHDGSPSFTMPMTQRFDNQQQDERDRTYLITPVGPTSESSTPPFAPPQFSTPEFSTPQFAPTQFPRTPSFGRRLGDQLPDISRPKSPDSRLQPRPRSFTPGSFP